MDTPAAEDPAAEWVWLPGPPGRSGRVLERHDLYGAQSVTVYTPANRRVQTMPTTQVRQLADRPWETSQLAWRLAATRLAMTAARGEPLLGGSTRVQLLPHQTSILRRALTMNPVRLAICCEVGLGKTTTAGAIVSELRARGRIQRVLVVAPKGVQLQWVAEMHDKFDLEFTRIGRESVPTDSADVWRAFDRVITTTDAVKPLRSRVGWDTSRVAQYNDTRFLGLLAAQWDLIIIDEAHHVAGSSFDVARHRLAVALATASPNLLLLTATPHSGKSDAFRRFLGLLDPGFAAGRPVSANTVAPVMARTVKRTAVDRRGNPLFRPRITALDEVPWTHATQHRAIYDAVTEWVRSGYVEARSRGDNVGGFLLLLFQRLVASSTAALISSLQRRRDAVGRTSRPRISTLQAAEDSLDLGLEDIDSLVDQVQSLSGELHDLEVLLELAHNASAAGPDPKTLHFFQLLQRLQQDERDSAVKVLIFTQFRGTQEMLEETLKSSGIACVTINGAMGLLDRQRAQNAFAGQAQVLISTDAGGEGVNLQFAHVVINWDLPWSPTLLEQRIGRVDRIGQEKVVRAINFVLADSVDQRALTVLEDKLTTILNELGIDKRSDVLETTAGLTESLYVAAIVEPDRFDDAVAEFEGQLRLATAEEASGRHILDGIVNVVAPAKESEMTDLLASVDRLAPGLGIVADPRSAALTDFAQVTPGEPAPVVSAEPKGWLAVVRIVELDGTASAFALHLESEDRPNPLVGERLWRAWSREAPVVRGTAPVPKEIRDRVTQAIGDYAYRTVQDLHSNTTTDYPAAQLALLVKIVSEDSES